MDTNKFLLQLQRMTIEEKLALLSDADKAYLQGYLDRVSLEFHSRLGVQDSPWEPALPKEPDRNMTTRVVSKDGSL